MVNVLREVLNSINEEYEHSLSNNNDNIMQSTNESNDETHALHQTDVVDSTKSSYSSVVSSSRTEVNEPIFFIRNISFECP